MNPVWMIAVQMNGWADVEWILNQWIDRLLDRY